MVTRMRKRGTSRLVLVNMAPHLRFRGVIPTCSRRSIQTGRIQTGRGRIVVKEINDLGLGVAGRNPFLDGFVDGGPVF